MNPGAALYDTQGRAVCQTCFDKLDLVATDHRAAANIRRAGYVSLAGGVASLFAPIAMGFSIVCAILTLTSGVYAIQSLARGNERFTALLTPLQRQLVWACTIGGIALMTLSFMGVNALLFLRR